MIADYVDGGGATKLTLDLLLASGPMVRQDAKQNATTKCSTVGSQTLNKLKQILSNWHGPVNSR